MNGYENTNPFRIVIKDNIKSAKVTTILGNCVLIWLLLSSISAFWISMFKISVSFELVMFGIFVISLVFSTCYNLFPYKKFLTEAIWIVVGLTLLIVSKDIFLQGVINAVNQSIDEIGRHNAYMMQYFGMKEDMSDFGYTTVGILTCNFIAVPVARLVIESTRKIILLMGLFGLILQIAMGFSPSPAAYAVSILFLAILLFKNKWNRKGRESLTIPLVSGYLFIIFAIIILIFNYSLNFFGEPKFSRITGVRESAHAFFDAMRYGGKESQLSQGDMSESGSFNPVGKEMLRVSMSKPQSYYLRGFIGTDYNGKRWGNDIDESLWSGRSLFYWTRNKKYYNQGSFSNTWQNLVEGESELNTVKIKNTGESREYIFTPYELIIRDDEIEAFGLDQQKIGDLNIRSCKFRGDEEYEYTSLESKVTQFPLIANQLLSPEDVDSKGNETIDVEQHYNEFAYSNYINIPANIRPVIGNILGEDKLITKDATHAKYSDAKQNIIYALTSKYSYKAILNSEKQVSDPLYYFIVNSKQGNSAHFASAAVMMFRYYGIPARYAEGYLITPKDVENMEPDKEYIIDDTHSHSWVEYYQDGVGWLPFEVTPSYLEIMEKPESFEDLSGMDASAYQANKEESSSDDKEKDELPDYTDWMLILKYILIAISIISLLLLLIVLMLLMREIMASKRRRALCYDEDHSVAIRSIFNYAMNIMSVYGLEVDKKSLYEYKAAVSEKYGDEFADAYIKAVDIRQEAVYSNHEMLKGQRDEEFAFLEQVWECAYKKGSLSDKIKLKLIYLL